MKVDARNATKIGISGLQPGWPLSGAWVFTVLGFWVHALLRQNLHMGFGGCSCLRLQKRFSRFKNRGLGTRAGLSKKDFGGRKSCVREWGRAWVQYWGRYVVQHAGPVIEAMNGARVNVKIAPCETYTCNPTPGGKSFFCYFSSPFQLRISAPFLSL